MRLGRNYTVPVFCVILASFSWAIADDEPAAGKKKQGRADPATLFKQLDANADGQVTVDEAGSDKERLFKRLLRNGDKDGNGQLSAEEFAAGLTPAGAQPADAAPVAAEAPAKGAKGAKGKPGRDPAALFQRLDSNGDGKVVADEVPAPRREFFTKMLGRLDKDGNGELSREEFSKARPPAAPPGGSPGDRPMAGAMRLVAAIDGNRDGQISAEEISGAADALKALDRDGDGSISRRELGAPGPGGKRPAAQAGGAPANQLVQRALQGDKNGDGKLSPEEAPERLQKAFAKIDANGDGQLEESELAARFAKAAKKQQGKPGKGKKGNKKTQPPAADEKTAT